MNAVRSHPLGTVPLDQTLGGLLYWAAEMEEVRPTLSVKAAPVFLLDSNRLRNKSVSRDVFDNRYFHILSDFPPAPTLKAEGIDTIVYVRPKTLPLPEDDLTAYFVSLQAGGLKFRSATLDGEALAVADFLAVSRDSVFSSHGTTAYSGTTRTYGRSYTHYHRFWSGSRSTWGSPSSGGGSRSYS